MKCVIRQTEEVVPDGAKTTAEMVAEVDALLSVFPEIGPIRACRRVGIPKETYYWNKRKKKPAPRTPETSGAGVAIEVPEGTAISIDASNGPDAAGQCGKAA